MAVVDTSTDVTGIGRTIEVEVGAMAHGGHCVARHEGRVVFVRHAVPGEKVRVALTEAEEGARFWRGDVVEVLRPSEFRRIHQWKLADMLRAYASGRPPVGGALTASTGQVASSRICWAVLPVISLPTGVRTRIPITIRSA